MSRYLHPLLVLLAPTLVVFGGCAERRSSTGWGAQVPADATRYVAQPVGGGPCAPGKTSRATTGSTARPAAPANWVSEITDATKVTIWHSYQDAELAALNKIAKAYVALGTKVSIKLRFVPFDGLNDKVKAALPEGDGPDLIIFAHDPLGAWSEMGLLEPLSQWTTAADEAPFLVKTIRALVYRKNLYGLPLAFKSLALYYNKALVPEPPETWDQLLTIVAAQRDKGRYGLAYEAPRLYFHAPWVHGMGGTVLDRHGRVHADGEASVKAAALARELVKKYKVTPISATTATVSEAFNRGKAAMVVNGPWMRGDIKPKIDYGVAPLPKLPTGKPARPFLTVEAVFMNKRSKHKKAAFEIMRWLATDWSATIRFELGRQPVANKAVWAERAGRIDDKMAAFREQAKRAIVTPSVPRMQLVWSHYDEALLGVIAGDDSPESAMAQAQKAIEEAFSKSGP